MTEREVVIQSVQARLFTAFNAGDMLEARNLQCLLESLEDMSDRSYSEIAMEECGAIS